MHFLGHVFEQVAVLCFAFFERLFCPFVLGDVTGINTRDIQPRDKLNGLAKNPIRYHHFAIKG